MNEPTIPTDGELLKLCDRVAGLIANGPVHGVEPDLARESAVRHRLLALLHECEGASRDLCETRGA